MSKDIKKGRGVAVEVSKTIIYNAVLQLKYPNVSEAVIGNNAKTRTEKSEWILKDKDVNSILETAINNKQGNRK